MHKYLKRTVIISLFTLCLFNPVIIAISYAYMWPKSIGFIVVGARKCNAEQIMHILLQHPKIIGASKTIKPKTGYLSGVLSYESLFYDRRNIPKAIQTYKQAKWILVIRDPVTRLQKQLAPRRKDFSVQKAFDYTATMNSKSILLWNSPSLKKNLLLMDGAYAYYLDTWLSVNDKAKILIVDIDQLSTHPDLLMNEIFSFLEISPPPTIKPPPPEQTPRQTKTHVASIIPAGMTSWLRAFYYAWNKKLVAQTGKTFSWIKPLVPTPSTSLDHSETTTI